MELTNQLMHGCKICWKNVVYVTAALLGMYSLFVGLSRNENLYRQILINHLTGHKFKYVMSIFTMMKNTYK